MPLGASRLGWASIAFPTSEHRKPNPASAFDVGTCSTLVSTSSTHRRP